MREAWHVIRSALRHTWDDLFTTAVVNLLWLFFNLLVITGPPATLALFHVANRIARGEPTDPGDFLLAFRRYFKAGWRWGLLNYLVIFFLLGDVMLTGRLSQSELARMAQGFYWAALAVWLFLQLYLLPFLFEQEEVKVTQALRNGVVMLGRNIPFSLALALLLSAILLAGLLFFFVTLAAGSVFVALVANHAVLNRLEPFRSPQGYMPDRLTQ